MPTSTVLTGAERRLLDALVAMKLAGDHQCDPVDFFYMEGLAKRIPTQPEVVRRLLAGKLQVALSRYSEKLSQTQVVTQVQVSSLIPIVQSRGVTLTSGNDIAATATNSLAELNHYIESTTRADVDAGLTAGAQDSSQMKSVRQFNQAWSRIRAEDQVEQAVLQGPKNPGPINSHMLVLRTLTLMRQLSPAYLQRFLLQADALLCLDKVTSKPSAVGAKSNSRGRQQK